MKKKQNKTSIWLVIKNIEKGFTFTKYFDTEFEKDKYKRKIKYKVMDSDRGFNRY